MTPIRIRLSSAPARRLLCWDIENRPSAYWYPGETTSEITAIAWKWRHEPECGCLLLRRDGRYLVDDGTSLAAGRALQSFRDILVSADVSYGHNVRSHDLRIFHTALLRAHLEPLPALLTTDTLRDYPKRKGMSASLENLAKVYELGGDKQHMSVVDWERANRLSPDGLELARERVVSDVLLQERLRDVLEERGLLGNPRVWRP